MLAPAEQLPHVAHKPVSLILPAFNQVPGLEAIVSAWASALDKLQRPCELLLIDDGSTEGADKLAGRFPAVKVLRHDAHRGPGAALCTGLAAAAHPLILTAACDYPYDPADLPKLLERIDTLDLVSGCRAEPMPAGMRWLSLLYRVVLRVLFGITLESPCWAGWRAWRRGLVLRWGFGVRLHDADCGLKLFRRSVFERIAVQSDGAFAHAEVLAKANFLGCLMDEVPVRRRKGPFRGASAAGDRWGAEAWKVFKHPEFHPPPAVSPRPESARGASASEPAPL